MMQSPAELVENDVASTLPAVISNNPRELLDAEQVSIENILSIKKKQKSLKSNNISAHIFVQPKPHFPLEITWYPNILNYDIGDYIINHKLRVRNASLQSIYIHCCGFWNERGRLGASWSCYPRTRFLLAPGLAAVLCIKATPKDYSPVPSAYMAIQLAAAHLRDHVVGYFAVPVQVKFLKPTMDGESEQE